MPETQRIARPQAHGQQAIDLTSLHDRLPQLDGVCRLDEHFKTIFAGIAGA